MLKVINVLCKIKHRYNTEMIFNNLAQKIKPLKFWKSVNNMKVNTMTQKKLGSPEFMEKEYENLTEEEFQSLMAYSPDSTSLTVEVVYATNVQQNVLEVQLPHGANIEDGIVLSGMLEQCEDIDLNLNKVGIHGVIKPLTELVSDGDRIEVYRPVIAKI